MQNSKRLAEELAGWIKDQVRRAGCEGVVLGISGGIDSAVTAGLSRRALGPDSVLGLIMPCHSIPEDEEHAHRIIETFGINQARIDLSSAFDALAALFPAGDQLATANIKPRLRMLTLYYFANLHHYLVIGTSNRSELAAGYFTKYGDGGSDILPLGSLLKYQVRDLAREIGVPQAIVEKAPSGGLWVGQTDEAEMGITYESLDTILDALDAGDTTGLDPAEVNKVKKMVAAAAHKRDAVPMFRARQ
jgi:NAD+ synthase